MGQENENQQQPNPWAGFGPGLTYSAANAGLGAIMGIATAKWQDKRQLKQQEALQRMQEAGNKRMADYQQKLALDMWNATGYEAQMEQMKAAGLNPAMMYAKGGPGGSTQASVSGVGSGSAASGQGEIMQGIGLMQQQQQMRLQDAQIKVMESQANKNNVEAEKTGGIDTEVSKASLGNILQSTKNAEAQELLIKADTYLKEMDGWVKNLEGQWLDATFEDRADMAYWTAENAIANVKLARNNAWISTQTIDEAISKIQNEATYAMLNNYLIEVVTAGKRQDITESEERVKKLQSDIKVNDAQMTKWVKEIEIAMKNSDQQAAAIQIESIVKSVEAYYKGENILGVNIQTSSDSYRRQLASKILEIGELKDKNTGLRQNKKSSKNLEIYGKPMKKDW